MNLDALNIIVTVAVAVVGWFVKANHTKLLGLETRLDRQAAELTSHKVEAAKTYVTRPDIERLEHKIDRVLDKLDQKADKP